MNESNKKDLNDNEFQEVKDNSEVVLAKAEEPSEAEWGLVAPQIKKLSTIALIVIAVFVAVATPLYYFATQQEERDSELESQLDSRETPSPALINDEVIEYDGQKFFSTVDGLGSQSSESSFVYAAEDLTPEEITEKVKSGDMVVVDAYVAFTGIKSVNTILNSVEALKAYIDEQKMVLVIHPVLTTYEASSYIPETVAQVSAEASHLSWDAMEEALAATSIRVRSNYGDDVMYKLMEKIAENNSGSDINESTLKARPFNSWLKANQEEVNKAVEDYIPAIYVAGEEVDNDTVNVLDTNELFSVIDKKLEEKQ